MNKETYRIIGIDPGSVLCGYAVIEVIEKQFKILESGTFKVRQGGENFPNRIKLLYDSLMEIIIRHQPNLAAIETAFFSKNPQSIIKLSMARSAAILAILNNKIQLTEYSPREIKLSATGNGNSSKEQVRYMMSKLFDADFQNEKLDTTDALSIAVCHYYHLSNPLNSISSNNNNRRRKKNDWNTFISKNSDRIIKF